MILVWLKFIICAGMIFFAGTRVAKYGDIIAEKTGLGGLWIGLVLVALCTSLPEIFTGIGSVVFVDAPDLTIGNLFGANTYNLLNIALLDFLHKGAPLLSIVSAGQLLTAGLSLAPLLIAVVGIFLCSKICAFGFFHISIFSILILASYLICIGIIFKFEKNQRKTLKEIEKETQEISKYEGTSLKKAFLFYGLSAVVIVVAGIWLAYIGDELARILGLGQSFIGSLFLGFTTTLPEITVSVAALRLGAKEMAVANMLGSNLFNISIFFINDAFYKKAHIFQAVSREHLFTGFLVIFMTLIIIAALILRPKKKKWRLSSSSIMLIFAFLIGAYINFFLQAR